MKASVVYNKRNEPRVVLRFETDAERTLFRTLPDLACIKIGEENDRLADLTYTLLPNTETSDD